MPRRTLNLLAIGALTTTLLAAQSFVWVDSPKLGRRMLVDLDNQTTRKAMEPDPALPRPPLPAWIVPAGATPIPVETAPHLMRASETHGAYAVSLTVPETRRFYDRVLSQHRCSQKFWELERVPGSKALNTKGKHFTFCSTPEANIRVSFRPEADYTRVYLTYEAVPSAPGRLQVVSYDDGSGKLRVQDLTSGQTYAIRASLFDKCFQYYRGGPECKIRRVP